ncbi:MAG: phosphate/phosphite/phosphonate ABC transporter substrate-binding protein [Acidimicrobiia bacterium]|nr:phosphate/phosphite/phosphonate ABC transporter substrate-binding protein [Acidimicrobiia bacterium]
MLLRVRSRPVWLMAIVAMVFTTACGPSQVGSEGPLTIGVVPDQAPERIAQKYESLIDRLETATGHEVELIVPADYADLVARFSAGDIDIGYFGGVTYLLARDQVGAEPLAMRDVDARFTSVFLTRSSDERTTVEEFSGADLGFVSEFSTSGHLMPRHHFTLEFGATPEDHFGRVSYSGAHDRAIEWLVDGTVDVAAVSTPIFNQFVADGILDPALVRVLYETPIYVDYVFAGSPNLSEETAATVRDTLLGLAMADDADRAILLDLGATRFLHAFPRMWNELEAVSRDLGLIDAG